jgi:hypothetical protein
MPANLKQPFAESCCYGGICATNALSAQPCGCDRGENWPCQQHRKECEVCGVATFAPYVRCQEHLQKAGDWLS